MLSRLLDQLLYWDYNIWYYINAVWHNDMLDIIAPFFQNQLLWAPLYLFALAFMVFNFGKKGWFWCAGFIISFTLGECISSFIIKPFFHRLSPCNNPYLNSLMHQIISCGSDYSFTSSLSANHFAIATFTSVTLQQKTKWVWLTIIWATIVAYSQVYVGLSFPSDVICGALLGSLIGVFIGKLFNNSYSLIPQIN